MDELEMTRKENRAARAFIGIVLVSVVILGSAIGVVVATLVEGVVHFMGGA